MRPSPTRARAHAPQLIIEWAFQYSFIAPTVIVSYTGTGSGAGKSAIIARTVDFAASDSPLSAAEARAGGDLEFLPIAAGGIVLIYNVPELAAAQMRLRLDRSTTAAIFLGTISNVRTPARALARRTHVCRVWNSFPMCSGRTLPSPLSTSASPSPIHPFWYVCPDGWKARVCALLPMDGVALRGAGGAPFGLVRFHQHLHLGPGILFTRLGRSAGRGSAAYVAG